MNRGGNHQQAAGRSRTAVHVIPSPDRDVQQKLEKITYWEQQLSKLESNNKKQQNNNLLPQINEYRALLCETLADVILTKPYIAQQNDLVLRLWKDCFYGHIGPTRMKIQKLKKKKAPPKQIEQQVAKLQQFLHEGYELYEYLCDKLTETLGKAYTNTTKTSNDQHHQDDTSSLSSMPTTTRINNTSATTAGIVVCLHRLYIHLGDLLRYSGQQSHKAERAYMMASQLGPGIGHAYNQLAVIGQVGDNNNNDAIRNACNGLYYYVRSLGAKVDPFATSISNLKRLYNSNREWLQQHHQEQQQQQQQQNTSSKNSKNVVLGSASRLFLAQFVDWQFVIMVGTEEKVDCRHRLETMVSCFQQLLQSSAFGDNLLCKLVTILAFSEFHNRDQKNDNQKNMSRAATFQFANGLAERVQQIVTTKLAKSPNKLASIRVLVPLLLVTEYLLSDGMNAFITTNDEELSSLSVAFWKSVLVVMNLLVPLVEKEERDPQRPIPLLKEYQHLIGFAPFGSFLSTVNATTTASSSSWTITEDGYLTDECAWHVLEEAAAAAAAANSATQESQATWTSSGTASTANLDATERTRLAMQRFVGLRERLLLSLSDNIRASTTNDGTLEWVEDTTMFENNDTMDMEDIDDAGDVFADADDDGGGDAIVEDRPQKHASEEPILTYQQNETGGPALLVPGALLRSRMSLNSSSGKEASPTMPPAIETTLAGTVPPQEATVPFLQSNVARNEGASPTMTVAMTDKIPASTVQPLGATVPLTTMTNSGGSASESLSGRGVSTTVLPVLPPPGFGKQQENTGGGAAPLRDDSPSSLLLPGYSSQNLGLPQQSNAPTVGETYDLFGGPSAIQTANPWAVGTTPLLGSSSGGMSDPATTTTSSAYGIFGPEDPSRTEGASFLDSGLLNSILMDDNCPRKRKAVTKNPFST